MGKTSNRKMVTLTNKMDGQSYFVSIIPVSKQIQIPLKLSGNLGTGDMSLDNIEFNDITMQAAIYSTAVFRKNIIGSLFSKPLLIINLDDGLRQIAIDDFKAFVTMLLTEERLKDLSSDLNSRKIFEKHGYMVASYDIWSIFYLSKVKDMFVFRKN